MKEFIEKLIGRLEERRLLHAELAQSEKLTDEEQMIQVRFCGCFSKAKAIVNELAEEYKGGWIPCSERLPECEKGCETIALLFQLKDTNSIWCGYYGEAGKYRDKYFRPYTNATEGFDARDVIAWQPLPAPYKEGCE